MTFTLSSFVDALRANCILEQALLEQITPDLLSRYNSPKALADLATKQALGVMGMLHDVPLQLNQIVSDVQTGRLTVQVNNEEINRLSRSLNDLGSKLVLGLVACSLILGSCFFLARIPLEVRGVPVAAIVGLLAAAGALTVVFWWHVLYGRIRKIRLMFWIDLFRRSKGKRSP